MKQVNITIQKNPKVDELKDLLERSFKTEDSQFGENQIQAVDEWIDISKLVDVIKTDGVLLEARDEDHLLVGMAFVMKQNAITWPDGNKAELLVVAVDPRFRNQGIGARLLKKREEEAKKFGAKKLIVSTHINRKDLTAFYESHEYKQMGILENYFDNGDAVFYYKDLD